jgi:predicted metal-dependent phosphoesterase TrpH
MARGRPRCICSAIFCKSRPRRDSASGFKGHQDSRRERNRKLIAKLNSLGVEITLEEVQVLGKHLTGRPHFAKILLRKGYVKTNQEAFDRYLADNASASVERDEPELVEGVRVSAKAAACPRWRIPCACPERDRVSLEKLLRTLIDNGLQGLEVYHSEHSPEDTALYKELAAQFQLIETGGTDFHGDNKPSIHLGTGKGGNVKSITPAGEHAAGRGGVRGAVDL